MSSHRWTFSTIGGVKRVNLSSAEDLLKLDSLDPKLWTALSCPVQGLEIESKTLELIDTDRDGQIRVPEVLAAVRWTLSILRDPADLMKQEERMPLEAIDPEKENGARLLASARIIRNNLDPDAENRLGVAETSDTARIFANTRLNGDGIITQQSTDDVLLQACIGEIMAFSGAQTDRSGVPGIGLPELQLFYDAVKQQLGWVERSIEAQSELFPFGEATAACWEVLETLRAKLDDYFLRCRLAAYDEGTTAALNLQTERVAAISASDLLSRMDEIATYPLAHISAAKPLQFKQGLNPYWEKAIGEFKSLLFPQTESLTEDQWEDLKLKLKPYGQWRSEKPAKPIAELNFERLSKLVSGSERSALEMLIQEDLSLANEAAAILEVDQLVRYYRDLFKLLQNFVTFYDFYEPGNQAIFQNGTLYIDQRSTTLCLKVLDMSKHTAMVGLSGIFVLYCKCTRKSTQEEMVIAAALTNGDIDDLIVGRNALFYDRLGRDWDATVLRIVENPISIRQAFWAPYRKVSRFIENQMNKFAAAQDSKSEAALTKGISETATQAEQAAVQPTAPPPTPFDIGKFVGIFAAISLALGAIGTALASILGGFMGLVWWKMPIAIAGVLLLISGPSMLLAWLKLRKRNLAPLLDANGWAINAKATINIAFGRLLTQLATLPMGAQVNFKDPFAKQRNPFLPWLFLLGLIAGSLLYALLKGWLRF